MKLYSIKPSIKQLLTLTAVTTIFGLTGCVSPTPTTTTNNPINNAILSANAMGINTTSAVAGAVTGALTGTGKSAVEIAKSATLGAINGGLTPVTTNPATDTTTPTDTTTGSTYGTTPPTGTTTPTTDTTPTGTTYKP